MKPLQAIGLGLLVIALEARFDGYDAYADPAGWLLCLYGVHRLGVTASPVPHRPALAALGLAALAVSAVLWFPAAEEWLQDAEAALAWAANLPRFGFLAVLCHGLAAAATGAARAGTDPRGGRAAAWLRTCEGLLLVVLVAPVLVLGAGWSGLGGPAALAAQAAQLVLAVLSFTYAGRPWAGAAPENAAR